MKHRKKSWRKRSWTENTSFAGTSGFETRKKRMNSWKSGNNIQSRISADFRVISLVRSKIFRLKSKKFLQVHRRLGVGSLMRKRYCRRSHMRFNSIKEPNLSQRQSLVKDLTTRRKISKEFIHQSRGKWGSERTNLSRLLYLNLLRSPMIY